jgi:hypothetical protein
MNYAIREATNQEVNLMLTNEMVNLGVDPAELAPAITHDDFFSDTTSHEDGNDVCADYMYEDAIPFVTKRKYAARDLSHYRPVLDVNGKVCRHGQDGLGRFVALKKVFKCKPRGFDGFQKAPPTSPRGVRIA